MSELGNGAAERTTIPRLDADAEIHPLPLRLVEPSEPAPSAGTRAFLFSDLRGYTSFVETKGDGAAAELLATYRRLVRSVIALHDGAEIRTEGDSFYVIFPTASAAVEAGLEIVVAAAERSTPDRPIRVGIGIHAGEAVETSEGLVGGAVNIAARVCAKARAGEVLVTDTVRALTRTFLPYRYTSLGPQQLKGVAGSIAIYRVEPTPSGRAGRIRRQLSARRGRVALVVGVALVLIASASGFVVANRGPDCLTLGPATKNVVAKIDPARNCVIATYPTGRGPSLIVWAHNSAWVANRDDHTVSVLSPDGRPRAVVGAGTSITAMAADDANLWVLDGAEGVLYWIELDSTAVRSMELAGLGQLAPDSVVQAMRADDPSMSYYWDREGYRGLAAEPGRVWVTNTISGQLIQMAHLQQTPVDGNDLESRKNVQIDPAPDLVKWSTFGGGEPWTANIEVLGRTIWIAHHPAPGPGQSGMSEKSPDLAALDTATGTVNHFSLPQASGGATALTAVNGELWATFSGGQVARSHSGAAPTVMPVAEDLAGMAGGANEVWVVSPSDHQLIGLDPTSMAVKTRINMGGNPAGVTLAQDGSVWVTIQQAPS